jgi:hypothetical protein
MTYAHATGCICLIVTQVLQQPSTGTVLQADLCQPQEPQPEMLQVQAAAMQPQQQQIGFDLPADDQTAVPASSGRAGLKDHQTELEEAQGAEGYMAVRATAAAGASLHHSSSSSSSSAATTRGRASFLDHRSPSAKAADLDTPVTDSTAIATLPRIGG